MTKENPSTPPVDDLPQPSEKTKTAVAEARSRVDVDLAARPGDGRACTGSRDVVSLR